MSRFLDTVLSQWKKERLERPRVEQPPLVVSVEAALTGVQEAACRLRHHSDLTFKLHYLSYLEAKLGYKPEDLLRQATEKGYGETCGHVHGVQWMLDPALRGEFAALIKPFGYDLWYGEKGSDGPEAPRFTLAVTLRGIPHRRTERLRRVTKDLK